MSILYPGYTFYVCFILFFTSSVFFNSKSQSNTYIICKVLGLFTYVFKNLYDLYVFSICQLLLYVFFISFSFPKLLLYMYFSFQFHLLNFICILILTHFFQIRLLLIWITFFLPIHLLNFIQREYIYKKCQVLLLLIF